MCVHVYPAECRTYLLPYAEWLYIIIIVISPTKMNFTAFRVVMFSAAKPHNWKIPGSVEEATMLK